MVALKKSGHREVFRERSWSNYGLRPVDRCIVSLFDAFPHGTLFAIAGVEDTNPIYDRRGLMKILIATDGSTFSGEAIEKACEVAGERKDVSFKVVAIYEPAVPMASEPFAIAGEYYQRLDDFGRQQAQQAAEKGVEFIRSKFPDPTVEVSMLVELGRPATIIVDAAEGWSSDLIIVGSHGHGFWGRLALGSVSDAVLHRAPCSVLVVKSHELVKRKNIENARLSLSPDQ